jgi:hypothetical protein
MMSCPEASESKESAGVPAKEIEVTPAMIEAGVSAEAAPAFARKAVLSKAGKPMTKNMRRVGGAALSVFFDHLYADLPRGYWEDIAIEVYEAIESSRLSPKNN